MHLDPNVDNSDVIEKLLNKGANPNISNFSGETPLHLYCSKDHSIKGYQQLLEKGALLDKKDQKGRTALHIAVIRATPKHTQILLEKGADPNARDDEEKTPLHYACSYKISSLGERHPCLSILMDYKADPTIQDINKDTPMHLAAKSANKHTAKVLLDHGGKVACNMKNNKGKLPLQEGLFDFLKDYSF